MEISHFGVFEAFFAYKVTLSRAVYFLTVVGNERDKSL